MELIPDLPNDVGLECLIRLPYHHLSTAASVSHSWKWEIQLHPFRKHRKSAGLTQHIVVMVQSRVDTNRKHGLLKYSALPVYRLTVCDPETGHWSELPPVPGYSDGFPLFCRIAAVGYNLMVIGGLNPENWEASNSVFVYSFLSATWRRGSDMPGSTRSFFGCGSDNDRTVFVAGGHDDEKNALGSAMMYDVAGDVWAPLPDMADERDECKVAFHRGKFYVIGGYNTQMQGQFGKSAEAFDPRTFRWDPVEEEFLDSGMCPRTCVDGGDGRMYMCEGGAVLAVNHASSKQIVARLPDEICSVPWITEWRGKLLVIGSDGLGLAHKAYLLDLNKYKWTKMDVPETFSGNVQYGCCMEI